MSEPNQELVPVDIHLDVDLMSDWFDVEVDPPAGITHREIADCLIAVANELYRRDTH